jgi:type IV secretory pathway TraG/TraD family ATPase VirD4
MALERKVHNIIKVSAFPFWATLKVGKGVWAGAKWVKRKVESFRRKPAYGDSRFAKAKELHTAGGGFVLGRLDKRTVYTAPEHGCIFFGRAGSGKSSILAASLREAKGEHFVVSDPPSDLYNRFCGELEAKGYRVIRIDLDRPGMAYDVCAVLESSGTLSFDRDLNALAGLVTGDIGSERENKHFVDMARVFVKGILGWLFHNQRHKAHPAGVAELLLSASEEEQEAVFAHIMRSGDRSAAMAVRAWTSASGPETGSFRSTLTRALEPWTWENVRQLTEWDGDVDNRLVWQEVFLSAGPCAVFLTGGMEQGRDVTSVTRTFFGQCAGVLGRLYGSTGRLPRPVRLMVDEGAGVGRCEPIMEAVVKLRKVGVTVFLCYQSHGQLEVIWGKHGAITLMDNTDLLIAGGSKDFHHYEAISKLAGRRTLKTLQKHAGGESVSEAGGYLITPDEIYGLASYSYLALTGNRAAVLQGIDGLKATS